MLLLSWPFHCLSVLNGCLPGASHRPPKCRVGVSQQKLYSRTPCFPPSINSMAIISLLRVNISCASVAETSYDVLGKIFSPAHAQFLPPAQVTLLTARAEGTCKQEEAAIVQKQLSPLLYDLTSLFKAERSPLIYAHSISSETDGTAPPPVCSRCLVHSLSGRPYSIPRLFQQPARDDSTFWSFQRPVVLKCRAASQVMKLADS